jgi:hypothetical protein
MKLYYSGIGFFRVTTLSAASVLAVAPAFADVSDRDDGPGFAVVIIPAEAAADIQGSGIRGTTPRTGALDGLRITVDPLNPRPALQVQTEDQREAYRAGDTVRFRSASNYPWWIVRADIVIFDPISSGVITVLATTPNGTVDWTMPADGHGDMVYVLRVYDAQGRIDETGTMPLLRREQTDADGASEGLPIITALQDQAVRREIPIHGALVTVSGRDLPISGLVKLMNETVVSGARTAFVVERILPPGQHELAISAGCGPLQQTVTVPASEYFSTAIADIAFGRDRISGELWRTGRIAGLVQGVMADGTRITGSIDTRDKNLDDLFRHVWQRDPDQLLRQIKDQDVWITTGDDSRTVNITPTSGRIYLRMDRDDDYLMWGDFRPASDISQLVRTDRTLYGSSGGWQSLERMPNGEPVHMVSGFAAQLDRLTERDVFRETGGSAFFLSRRGIAVDTETVVVQVRDRVSGRIASSHRLVEGRDYRFDHIQGVILLYRSLTSTAYSSELLSNGAHSDFDVNLVVQYDYVPSGGADLSGSLGGRAQTWVTPGLRLGTSGMRETAGLADNTLSGLDIRLQRHDGTYLQIDLARSEGPGFGSRVSLTNGLTIDDTGSVAGSRGQPARGSRIEGRFDFADIGGEGHVTGWHEDRKAGFWSPDYNTLVDQTSSGFALELRAGAGLVKLGYAQAEQGNLSSVRRASVGYSRPIGDDIDISVEVSQQTRVDTTADARDGENGSGTDIGARLGWSLAEGSKVWIFGQYALQRSGDLPVNDRLGFGAEVELGTSTSFSGEVSTGVKGMGGVVELRYQPNSDAMYRLGLRDDPAQSGSSPATARRGLTLGADRKINERWSTRTDVLLGSYRNHYTSNTTSGLSFQPNAMDRYDLGVVMGQARDGTGMVAGRDGLSVGFSRASSALSYRLRGEYRQEQSGALTPRNDSWVFAADLSYQASDDWRFLGSLDFVTTGNDDDATDDGRYVEGKIGYAWRPADMDRFNALVSYIFLDDQPGQDQLNVDGSANGPRQQSHILNMALTYQLDPQWTLSAKYGLRYRDLTEQGSEDTVASVAHLAILRADYRIIHKWDIMAEVRTYHFPQTDRTETGALLGVYREVSANSRIGVGYAWGGVSDDLRTVEPAREGFFVNIIAKF